MVFLVVVFLSVRVCVCCARCNNEDLFFKKRKVFVVFIPLFVFCLLFFVFALI